MGVVPSVHSIVAAMEELTSKWKLFTALATIVNSEIERRHDVTNFQALSMDGSWCSFQSKRTDTCIFHISP